jgi:hypothetical protein
MTPNISPQFSAQLDRNSRVAHILWFALMASVAIYGGVVFLLASQAGEAATTLPLPPLVFAALAAANAATGIVMYRQFTSPDRIRARLQQPPAQHSGENQAQLQALSAEERRLASVPALVLTASIIRWALFESVAIFGLVQAITSRSFEVFLPYGLAAIALQAMTPPRLKQVTLEAVPLLSSDAR